MRRLLERIHWPSDAGWAGGGEMIPFCVLVFVTGTLLVTNLWGVIDTKMATNGAAREAARLVAESNGPADKLGEEAALASIEAHGHDPGRVTFAVGYLPEGATWAPCARAQATVSYRLPLIRLPLLGVATGGDVTVTSTHSEIIDPYRSRAVRPHREIPC